MMKPRKLFIDTTILCDILLKSDKAAKAAVSLGDPAQLSEYAIKEFRVGPLYYWIWAHNKLVTTGSVRAFMIAVNAIHRRPNQMRSALEAFGDAYPRMADFTGLERKYGESADPDKSTADALRLILASRIRRAWKNRAAVADEVVDHLACFEQHELKSSRNRLEFKPWGCPANSYCGAANLVREEMGYPLDSGDPKM